MAEIPDSTLISWAKAGRAAGFEQLVARYERFAFTLALRVVKRREQAEEVAQDSFLKAFRGLNEWRGEGKFSTWLYRIVFTTALNSMRKNGLETRSLDETTRPFQVSDDQPTALEHLENEWKTERIQAALEALSPDDAAILTLFYLNEQSLEEAGEILQISANTAKTRLCRARQRMKTLVETQFKTEFQEWI